MIETAMLIYEEYKDMDFWDYAEHYENDIAYIVAMIESIGEKATRAFLNNL